jgi:hypothetical protein
LSDKTSILKHSQQPVVKKFKPAAAPVKACKVVKVCSSLNISPRRTAAELNVDNSRYMYYDCMIKYIVPETSLRDDYGAAAGRKS